MAPPAPPHAGDGDTSDVGAGRTCGDTVAASVCAGAAANLSARGRRQCGGPVAAIFPAGDTRDPAEADPELADGAPAAWRALVVFSGDGLAPSTLETELQARGADVDVVDTAVGGSDHNLTRPAVAERVL
eukprot:518910-Pleurochrysis_carterae.AAC.1